MLINEQYDDAIHRFGQISSIMVTKEFFISYLEQEGDIKSLCIYNISWQKYVTDLAISSVATGKWPV